MSDKLPTKAQVVVGVMAVALFAVLGTVAVGSRAADDCRSAVSQATTPYKVEKALRSAACKEVRDDARTVP